MDPLECYTFEEAIKEKYAILPNNIQKKGNQNPESKRGTIQTANITETPQGGVTPMKYGVFYGIEASMLEDERDDLFRNLMRSH